MFAEASVARLDGRDPSDVDGLVRRPQNLTDYMANLRLMLEGVKCLMLRRQGEVWDLLPKGDYRPDDKKLRGYDLAWERSQRDEDAASDVLD